MKKNITKLNFSKIKTVSLMQRKSKVNLRNFSSLSKKGAAFKKFLNCMPDILAASDFKNSVAAIKKARSRNKPIILMMGAHVIKCGLSPLLIDLMQRGFVNHCRAKIENNLNAKAAKQAFRHCRRCYDRITLTLSR